MDQINADVAWFSADQARRVRPVSGPSWTEDRVELLRKLWTEGLSCSEIAVELPGFSRNAVISKVHRLGLPGRKERRVEVRKPRDAPRKRYQRTGFGTYRKLFDLFDIPATSVDDLQISIAQRKTLIELEFHHCKWPIGDPGNAGFFFCGANRLDDRPYCRSHCIIAYRHPGHAA